MAGPNSASSLQVGNSTRKVTVNGLERSYILHIPPGLDISQAVPLVFVFHGGGQEPAAIQFFSGLDEVADNGHFVLVYPEGVGYTWNAGGVCCGDALANNIDEAAFVREIISDLETVISIDAKQIYATGFSNGAILAYRLACQMSDVFAAIASVAGTMIYSPCQPRQPVSVMHIHGLDDSRVPYGGGGEFNLPSAEQTIATWVDLNDCPFSATVNNPIDKITHSAYISCKAGTAVELYAIESGGHGWVSEHVYPMSETIWDFFTAHPKP